MYQNGNKAIVCNDCKRRFPLKSVQIQEQSVDISGKLLRLVYFRCPKCNRLYKVAIMDEQYDVLAKQLEYAKERIKKCNGNGNEYQMERLCKLADNKKQKLANHVSRLRNRYDWTFDSYVGK